MEENRKGGPVKRSRPKKKKNVFVIVISVVLIVACVLTVAAVILLNSKPFSEGEVQESFANEKEITKDFVNVLVIGIDSDVNDPSRTELLTDTMMIASFDIKANTMRILQLPRDTYVGDDYATGKLNAVYKTGKEGDRMNTLIAKLYDMFKLPIDHYVTITMDGFREAIDAIGGVPMDVPYDVVDEGQVIIQKGQQTLSGSQAEMFVRIRHMYANQDLGRMFAQRIFMTAMVKELLNSDVSEVLSVVTKVYDKITTDLTIGEAGAYVKKAMKLDMDKIEMYIVPGEGAPNNVHYTIHKNETAELLNEKFRPYSSKVPAEELNVIELSHKSDYYDNSGNTMGEIDEGGVKPGRPKSGSSTTGDSSQTSSSGSKAA